MRVEETDALNAVLRGVRSPDEKRTNGGCPLGVELPPYNMYAIPNAPAANTTNKTLFFMVYLPAGPPPGSPSPGGRRQRQKPRSLKTTGEKCWFGCACRHIVSHATICKKQKQYNQRIPPAGTAEVARRRLRRLRLQPRREKAPPAGSSLRRQPHCLARRCSQRPCFLNPICFAVPLEPRTSLFFTVEMVEPGQQGAAILVLDL